MSSATEYVKKFFLMIKIEYDDNRKRLSYGEAFDEALYNYANKNEYDSLYNILYKEKFNSEEIEQYMENANIEYFYDKISVGIYEKAKNPQINVDFPKTEENERKIAEFCAYLLHSLLYNTYSHSKTAAKLIKDWKISATYKMVLNMYRKKRYSKKERYNPQYKVDKIINGYFKNFTEPLFLHRNPNAGEVPVSLKDVFVYPKFAMIDKFYINQNIELEDFISNFISGNVVRGIGTVRLDTLFILGHAGIGKSSLVSKMIYHYKKQDDTCKKIFGDKQVICIKLRDMNKEWLKNADLWYAVYQYFGYVEVDEEHEFFKNKIVIMDGFDELCIIDNISKNLIQRFAEDIGELNSKLIVTSRPGYKDENTLTDGECSIELQFFEEEKKIEWFDNYIFKSKEDVTNIKNGICKSKNDILGVPLIIYMATVKKIYVNSYKNKWELFKKLFSEEIYIRGYDKSHRTNIYSNKIYRLIKEIAFAMYQMNTFTINKKKIDNMIEELYGKDTISSRELKNCYAVNTYFKESREEDGAVEFCHNEIRDFFICECIASKLNECIEKNIKEEQLIQMFQQWFALQCLNENTINFLYERLHKSTGEDIKYYIEESKNHRIKNIYKYMLDNGFLYGYKCKYPQENDKNIFQTIYNIFFAVYSIYHSMYIFMDSSEKIEVLSSNERAFIANMSIRNSFTEFPIVHLINADLVGANLSGILLSGAELINADLRKANLTGTTLMDVDARRADLSEADLSEADLKDADLSRANLSEAYLRRANLSQANLYRANLSGTNLISATLSRANLSEAHLIGADLRRACLFGTFLRNVDLIGADLREADLSEADLKDANLSKSYLQKANLSGANLSGVDFSDATMDKATYDTCDFNQACNIDKIIIK